GDEILLQVARRLEETVRKTDFVARLGGDEFAVTLVDVGGPIHVMAFVERL
ncbi:MAG: diguanylate cyclase, partial [Rhodoblastus sp.]|nr:diguanylate cyclase [Rhodoblastus sp.]